MATAIRSLAALIALGLAALASAADEYVAPRGPGGEHPDLNGIWQALNSTSAQAAE